MNYTSRLSLFLVLGVLAQSMGQNVLAQSTPTFDFGANTSKAAPVSSTQKPDDKKATKAEKLAEPAAPPAPTPQTLAAPKTSETASPLPPSPAAEPPVASPSPESQVVDDTKTISTTTPTVAIDPTSDAKTDSVDFSEDRKVGIPLRGAVSEEYAWQFGEGARQIRQGPRVDMTLDWNTEFGVFFADGLYRYNDAFHHENDDDRTKRIYSNEYLLKEAYWKKAFDKFSVSAGRIVTIWGSADALVVTDVISPRNQTEFFFARPQDIRLGQDSVKADIYFNEKSEFNLIYVPQAQANRFVEEGHPYYLYGDSITRDDVREDNPEEVGGRWLYKFDGGSVAAMAGVFHSRAPVLMKSTGATTYYEFEYPENPFYGLNFTFGSSPLLLKAEAAAQVRQAQQIVGAGGETDGYRRVDVYAGVLGVDAEITHFGTLTLEVSQNRPAKEFADTPSSRKYSAVGTGWSKRYFSDTLTLQAFLLNYNTWKNNVFRFGADYKILNDLLLTTQVTLIRAQSDDSRLKPFEQMDRFDISLGYYFDFAEM